MCVHKYSYIFIGVQMSTYNPLQRFFRQPKIYIRLPSKGNFYPKGAIDIPESGDGQPADVSQGEVVGSDSDIAKQIEKLAYRIEELENSLSETMKEFRKLDDSLPEGLKTVANGRISSISAHLCEAQKTISQLKEKIKAHKKKAYKQQVEEKQNQEE